jgi:putative ABC transport system permease protein
MTALALRSMGQRKLRSVLTALAVLLGVAMIAGTYVQTDRIHDGFENITTGASQGVDAVVTSNEAFTSDFAGDRKINQAWVERIGAVPGVEKAEGQLWEYGALVVDGEAVGGGFAPTLVNSYRGEPFSPLEFVEGGPPARTGDVAVNVKLAEDEGLEVGDRAGLTTRTGVKQVRIAGIAEFGGGQSLGGATLVIPLLADVQRWFGDRDEVTQIVAAAEDGVTQEQLAARIAKVLPTDLTVATGKADAQAQADEVNDALGSFLTPALLTLSGAALLVGAFIIFNTFSITVAQRTREFALLRALGASRRQVLGTVVLEALAIGVAASVLGLLGGLGFAVLIGALFDAAGFGIPTADVALAPRTIVVSLGVGILVTLVAAVAPARRATRVSPVAAMRDDPAPATTRSHRRRAPIVAAGVSLLGVAGLVQGLFGSGPAAGRLSALAGGAVLLFVGLALVSRYVVRPVAAFVGWPLERTFEEPGRLARENAMRNPGRTATTAAALMVGLGLVVFVSVFAAGMTASIDRAVDDRVTADIVVSGKGYQPVPAAAGQAVLNAEGVAGSSPQYIDQVRVNGEEVDALIDQINGIDPTHLPRLYDTKWKTGDDSLYTKLGPGRALVEEQFALTHDITVGERFTVESSTGQKARLTAIGAYEDPQIIQGLMVGQSTFAALSPLRDPFALWISAADGSDPSDVKAAVAGTLDRYPTAEVRTREEYLDVIRGQLDTLVYMLYALLAMSLVISLFGIANSLFLSIHERVREFGLLRAIGATRHQVQRVVRYESVITAVIGGVLGTLVGVFFAALATAALSDLGLSFALPVGQLAVFLLLAVCVGIAGAVVPARRAAATDVLEAMRHE